MAALLRSLLCGSLAALLGAQSPNGPWDASLRARGWGFCDVDGSLIFLEPGRQEFIHWDLAQGFLGTRPAPVLEERRSETPEAGDAEDPYSAAARLLYGGRRHTPSSSSEARKVFPERWIVDARDHSWVVVGRNLVESDSRGRILAKRALPAPVSDLVRGRDGFWLCYRTLNPFVQKFDWRGDVVWTYQRQGAVVTGLSLHRIAAHAGDSVLLAELGNLSFVEVGPGASGQVFFTHGGAVAEPLPLGKSGRGPMLYCPSRNAVLAVFSQADGRAGLPEGKGLALARFNLGRGTLEWTSTGLGEGHQLVAVVPKGALFTSPEGGLVVVPMP
jgi:hypothetical protein